MSYDVEELRTGIVEMFDDVTRLSPRREDFGVLHLAESLSSYTITDAKLIEQVRRVVTWNHPMLRARMLGCYICLVCGARAPEHRCPG